MTFVFHFYLLVPFRLILVHVVVGNLMSIQFSERKEKVNY